MNYRGFGWAWLVFWLTLPAFAETLTLGDLSLTTPAAWQRATAEEEADFDSIILREGAASKALEVYLPRQRTRLKKDEGQFIEQLEASWRRRYGEKVELEWLEAANVRWRVCRRPSRSGAGHVFQIVTVHDGEAYHLIAAVPPETEKLPDAVRALLASATWAGVAAPAAPATMAVAEVTPPQTAEPVAEPVVAPEAAPEAALPAPAKPGGRWRLLRQVIALPGGKAWAGLAEAENRLLGADGLVKGLGITAEAAGIEGFLEGFVWRKGEGAGEFRQPFRRHWRVLWPGLPEQWQGGDDLAFDLEFLATTSGLDSGGRLRVSFEVAQACAPRLDIVRWLDGLESRGPDSLGNLTKMVCQANEAAGPPSVVVSVADKDYPADATAKLSKHAALPLPVAWEQGIRVKSRAEVRRLVLTVRFQVSEDGRAPGDAMFNQAVAVFVFGPEV